MRHKKSKSVIECRRGRYYENGKPLRKKDYIFHASAHEPEYILTEKKKYRMSEVIFS